MERYKAREIVDSAIRGMLYAMDIQDWKIQIEYLGLEQDVQATCETDPRYKHATIKIDPYQIDGRVRLLEVLRHELLHIFQARMVSYRKQVMALVPESVKPALDVTYLDAIEEMVGHLEKFLDFCGLETDTIVRKSKAAARKWRRKK